MDRLGQRIHQALKAKRAGCEINHTIPIPHYVHDGFARESHLLLDLLHDIFFRLFGDAIKSSENAEDPIQILEVPEIFPCLWVIQQNEDCGGYQIVSYSL